MELTEFRVGNLVNYQEGTTKKQGAIYCINYTTITVGDFIDRHTVKVKSIEPIKLTERWIRDLGGYRFIGWDDMIFWRFDEFSPNIFELLELNGSGEIKYESPSGAIIEHVHTLQNTYYFHVLSGKELTLFPHDRRETT